jgi:hypothetical protein
MRALRSSGIRKLFVIHTGWTTKDSALICRPICCFLVGLATLAFATPLLFLLAAQGDHLPFSHEMLAYRYFTNVRILDGEGGDIWLPQGQLLTAILGTDRHRITRCTHRKARWRDPRAVVVATDRIFFEQTIAL